MSPTELSSEEQQAERQAPSMRLRIAVSVAALALVIILAQAVALLFMFEDMEEEFVDHLLTTQMEHSIALWRSAPAASFSTLPMMTLYRSEPGRPAPGMPDSWGQLPIGNHKQVAGDKEFRLAVREAGGTRFLLAYDMVEQREQLDSLTTIVMTGALMMGAAVLVLVYMLSGQLAGRLEWLARRVRGEVPGAVGYALPGMERELLAVAHALEVLEARQAELLARERNFTANLSHELRTPLTAIRTDAELIGALPGLPENVQRRALRMVDNADRIARLAESLLLLARETLPQLQEERCLAAEIETVWESLQAQHVKPVQLVQEIPEVALVQVDPTLLRLVLRNLLENALRHTDAGQVSCRLRGSVLEVADQGPGFAPEDLPRVFDRFFRRGAGGGHGLGLALVDHVCRACGWKVTAANGSQGGALLSLDLGASLRSEKP